MQRLVVNTLCQEVTDHHNQKDGFRETQKMGPCWKSQPVSCTISMELPSSCPFSFPSSSSSTSSCSRSSSTRRTWQTCATPGRTRVRTLMTSSTPPQIQGSTKNGPVLEVTTSCLYGKHGVEIRIWSLSEDNTQSWVRISHGSNKFVIDSNNNNTRVSEDLPEEQALQLNEKGFAFRSKAKAKPQRREPVDYSPSIIPMSERNWIDIEPGNYSLSAYEVSKKVIHLFRHSQTVQREDDGAFQFWTIKNYLQNQFPRTTYWSDNRWKACLAAGGRAKRRYQYCSDNSGTIIYLRALQGRSGRNLIDP